MFSNNQLPNQSMMERLITLTRESTRFIATTAYIGESAISILFPSFIDMVNREATAHIFIGRALTEGLYEETLNTCQNLHNTLTQTGGGIYATQLPFHNKIYFGQTEGRNTAWVGSSNLSINGLTRWREGNVKITAQHPSMREIISEIDEISALRVDLNQVRIIERTGRRPRIGVAREILEYPSEPTDPILQSLELPLYSRQTGEVQERSGLNWWNALGRPRNPNEACIGLSVHDIRRNLNFFPNRTHEGTIFNVYTDDGFPMEMQIEGSGPVDTANGIRFGKQIASRPEKRVFGGWILRRKLDLPAGTIVTRQILQNYGRETIEFVKINDTEYIMRF